MKMGLRLQERVITATLIDNSHPGFHLCCRLTLTLEDYAGTKISDLPKKLSVEGAGWEYPQSGYRYYAPWETWRYYRDFGVSSGLIILGKLDSGISAGRARQDNGDD
jgi:hypothetical protein